MKTEEFDDAIKRKLESINPAIDEKEIERVHAYSVNNRSPFSMLKTNRAFWLLMAMGMLATGLVTWKLTSMNSYNQNIFSKSQSQIAPGIETNKSTRIITKTDTIYVTKYVNKYSALYEKQKGFINKNTGKKGIDFAQGSVPEMRPKNRQTSGSEVDGNDNINSNLAYHTQSDSKASNDIDLQKISYKTGKTQVADTGKKNIPAKANSPVEVKKDSMPKAVKKMPVHNYKNEHRNTTQSKGALNLGFMAGIGGELANTQIGGGAYARLLLNRFSLNAGVKWMSVNYQHYSSDIDFNQSHPGDNFKWYYCRNLPYSYNVSNIQFAYSLWQIPVALEYDLPLDNNWSFSVSAGTDFDISCINALKYTTSENNEEGNQVNQTNKYPTVVFNNLIVSMGVIKQWGHLNLQVSPFVSQQIEKAWYKGSDKTFFGGNVKLFYRL